jgi:hypothetical protein
MSFSSKKITNEKSIKIKFVIVVSVGWLKKNRKFPNKKRKLMDWKLIAFVI